MVSSPPHRPVVQVQPDRVSALGVDREMGVPAISRLSTSPAERQDWAGSCRSPTGRTSAQEPQRSGAGHQPFAWTGNRPQGAGGTFQAERPHHSRSCRSRIRPRSPCQEIAVVQGSCGPASTGVRMNDCWCRLRTGATLSSRSVEQTRRPLCTWTGHGRSPGPWKVRTDQAMAESRPSARCTRRPRR